jgi:hypothetical protein
MKDEMNVIDAKDEINIDDNYIYSDSEIKEYRLNEDYNSNDNNYAESKFVKSQQDECGEDEDEDEEVESESDSESENRDEKDSFSITSFIMNGCILMNLLLTASIVAKIYS